MADFDPNADAAARTPPPAARVIYDPGSHPITDRWVAPGGTGVVWTGDGPAPVPDPAVRDPR